MSEPLTTDIIVPTSLIDRIAGLMVLLQKASPVDVLYEFKNLRTIAADIQQGLQKIRGPWAVCHICKPPKRINMEDMYKHDTEVHNAYRSK
jgi:hypothetical protein